MRVSHSTSVQFLYCHRRDRSRPAEQNPHQRGSTTETHDELEWLCCALHVFLRITPEFTPSIAPSQARAPRGRALRTQGPRSWTCSSRSLSRKPRGASTAARKHKHRKVQRPSPCKSCSGPSNLPHPADHPVLQTRPRICLSSPSLETGPELGRHFESAATNL